MYKNVSEALKLLRFNNFSTNSLQIRYNSNTRRDKGFQCRDNNCEKLGKCQYNSGVVWTMSVVNQ